MKLGLYFFVEEGEGVSIKHLPRLKTPKTFNSLPKKGEEIIAETISGEKISAVIREIYGHRTGISLGITPINMFKNNH